MINMSIKLQNEIGDILNLADIDSNYYLLYTYCTSDNSLEMLSLHQQV